MVPAAAVIVGGLLAASQYGQGEDGEEEETAVLRRIPAFACNPQAPYSNPVQPNQPNQPDKPNQPVLID